MIRLASVGPIPSSRSSCPTVAFARLSLAPAPEPALGPPPGGAAARAAPARGTTTCSPSWTRAARLIPARSAPRAAPPAGPSLHPRCRDRLRVGTAIEQPGAGERDQDGRDRPGGELEGPAVGH